MAQITVEYIDHMGSDLTTVNAARVSFGKESDWKENPFPGGKCPDCGRKSPDLSEECLEHMGWREYTLSDRDTKLIKYLAKHKHLSPFGHAFATFRVKAPIFVARQLVKHQYLRWNEISRRYVDDDPEFYTPTVWRGRSEDKKQGSSGIVQVDHYHVFVRDDKSYRVDEVCRQSYKALLDAGVAPEQARMVLPQSTMTEWYWSGSLDAFAAMCRLRCAPDTQYESRIVADQISEVMGDLFPVSWASLMENQGTK